MNLNDVVIVSTARTALTKSFRGSFNDTEAPLLGGMWCVRWLSAQALSRVQWKT